MVIAPVVQKKIVFIVHIVITVQKTNSENKPLKRREAIQKDIKKISYKR